MSPTLQAPPLRLVFWETTQACNLACKHCRASAVAWRDPAELDFDQARRMMDGMQALGRPVLVFSGGEPLMRPDIFELMAEAKRRGLPFALSTNGTLLDESMADKVAAAAPHRVSISLDGADAATHDTFRQVAGAFRASIDGMRRLRARGIDVQVNTSVTTHNHAVLPQVYDLVKAEGCVAWHLFMLVPVGCGLQIPDEQRLAAGQYERTLRWFAATQAQAPLEMKATCAPHVVRIARQMFPGGVPKAIQGEDGAAVGGRPSGAPAAMPGHPSGHPGGAHPSAASGKGCLAGRGICFVSRFGQVQGCGYLPVPAGQLKQQGLDEIWRGSPLFQRLRRPEEEVGGKCGVCEYVSDCMGCRARAFAVAGDAFAEEPHCAWVPAGARPRAGDGHA
ncbi:MAG TPA: radical SAM protein [bacterium]|nr:radical SAM protein [bacterium]